ncbi:MAG: serine/threonine-protein kinase, partial [Phascolarctobacterium sp.]|nr:serine/threonine-protein kinase [Phascolarctobacterium sp.]
LLLLLLCIMLEQFILENFTKIKEFNNTNLGCTELVVSPDTQLFVRRTLLQKNSAYTAVSKFSESKFENLVKIEYACVRNNKTYGIEEFLDGENLQDKLNNGYKFTEEQVVAITIAVAKAVKVLHDADILHRDIKPANILQLKNGTIKLMDLGSVRFCSEEKSRDTVILGTKDFAPPEQFGFSTTDKRSDIFALGKTMEALLPKDYKGPLTPVIDHAAAFDPRQRIASAEELIAELEKVDLSPKKFKFTSTNKIALGLVGIALLGGIFIISSKFTKESSPSQLPQTINTTNQAKNSGTSSNVQTPKTEVQPSIPSPAQPSSTQNNSPQVKSGDYTVFQNPNSTKSNPIQNKIRENEILVELSPITGNPWILRPSKDAEKLKKYKNIINSGFTLVDYEKDPEKRIFAPFSVRVTNLSNKPFNALKISARFENVYFAGTQNSSWELNGLKFSQSLNFYHQNRVLAQSACIYYPNEYELKDELGRPVYDYFLLQDIDAFFVDNKNKGPAKIRVSVWALNSDFVITKFDVKPILQ